VAVADRKSPARGQSDEPVWRAVQCRDLAGHQQQPYDWAASTMPTDSACGVAAVAADGGDEKVHSNWNGVVSRAELSHEWALGAARPEMTQGQTILSGLRHGLTAAGWE